jgi:hypothetical protein
MLEDTPVERFSNVGMVLRGFATSPPGVVALTPRKFHKTLREPSLTLAFAMRKVGPVYDLGSSHKRNFGREDEVF